MPIFIDPDELHRYVCECDRELPEDEQPVFILRVPTVREQTKIQNNLFSAIGSADNEGGDRASVSTEAVGKFGGGAEVALTACWRGVENWKKPDGTPIVFDANDDGSPTERMLASIGFTTRIELMNYCFEIMGLLESDRD